MTGYYDEKLSGHRLQRCYEIAPPRVKQYLDAEIEHVTRRLGPAETLLELGCGYGRVALRLAEVARQVVGIDTSLESIVLARELAGDAPRCRFLVMDALALCYPDASFDAVVCIQNGICAFGADQESLLREALRVARPGGVFCSRRTRTGSGRIAWPGSKPRPRPGWLARSIIHGPAMASSSARMVSALAACPVMTGSGFAPGLESSWRLRKWMDRASSARSSSAMKKRVDHEGSGTGMTYGCFRRGIACHFSKWKNHGFRRRQP